MQHEWLFEFGITSTALNVFTHIVFSLTSTLIFSNGVFFLFYFILFAWYHIVPLLKIEMHCFVLFLLLILLLFKEHIFYLSYLSKKIY